MRRKKHLVIRKKNKFFLFVFLLLVGVIIVFLTFFHQKFTYQKQIQISVGDALPTLSSFLNQKDLEKVKDQNITWQGVRLEDDKIYYAGTYQGTFQWKGKEYSVSLQVVDYDAPTIEGVKDITVFEGDNIDLLSGITATDNSHDEVTLKVEGDYDLNVANEYALSYVAIDTSGNSSSADFKLTVKKKEVVDVSSNQVVGKTSKGYSIIQKNGIYYIDDILIANKSYPLPSTYNPGGLLNDFQNAFSKMQQAASKDGISLSVISGFRSYARQNTLYQNYVNKDGKNKADTYSARPGYSEHQSGLAADINSLSQSFENTKEGKWLSSHCYEYGFIIRYPKGKEDETGYIYEPWHIRYVGKKLATTLYNNGDWITLENYFGIQSQYE